MNSDHVTVIIPTYNRAFFLKETIKSVLEQSYDNFQLLILDDHSLDNTHEIVNSFRDRRIKYIRHEYNLGLVANWTYGVRSANGRFLSILGDDDKYEPDFLKLRVEGFKIFDNAMAVTGAFTCIDNDGQYVRLSRSPCSERVLMKGTGLIKFILGFTGEWFNGATLYRTQIVQSLWNWVMMAGIALDFSLHIRLGMISDAGILFLPNSDMFLRVHKDQESKRNSIHLAECVAKMAIQMWNYEVQSCDRESKRLFRKRFADDIGHYSRMLWDRGQIVESRNAFKTELSVNPFRSITWLRLIRAYLKHPQVIRNN